MLGVKRQGLRGVPVDLHAASVAVAERRGHVRSGLVLSWVIDAARVAAAGHGELLPRAEPPARRGHAEPSTMVFWTQGDLEYARCSELIEGAGSSLIAVVKAALRAYVEADGALIDMAWPPASAERQAA